jgi:curved DNA-binding protein CbpA
MSFVDYYDVLQVSPRADAEVIEKAYRVLIGKHHPDKGGDTRHAQQLNEAHDVLGDPRKRADYDRDWAGHQNRAVTPPRTAAPGTRRRHAAPPASWVAGPLLVVLGLAFMAAGSGFVGLLFALVGVLFLFNLSGLWLLLALLALGACIVVRHGPRARRNARVART